MRKGLLRLSLLGLALVSACADDLSQPAPSTMVGGDGSRIHRADSGRLTGPSTAAAPDVVRGYLEGFVANAVDQLTVVSQTTSAGGISHVRFEQSVGGLRVHGAYVKAAITDRGELVQVIENLAPAGGLPRAALVKHKDALAAAMKEHGYDFATPAQASANGQKLGFDKGSEFYRDPSVERVAYVDTNGQLRQGYLVETWSFRGNQLDHTLVGGNGQIISTERRTANDSYKVFVEDPGKGGQVDVTTAGWLSGAQTTQNISGPNAHAYIDADANNQPDSGGTAVTDGIFGSVADLGASPTTTTNRNVAVQNLFYLNNQLHDVLAQHGFTPATGNFEGNDPVNAEAQDGSGTDNANMSTPADGSSPRMQMYLWTGVAPTAYVTANGTAYPAFASSFGAALTTGGTTAALALANDGVGVTSDACESMPANSLSGKVALVDRGTCDFVVKVKNAQSAGAVAVVIANNVAGNAFSAGGSDRKIKIPSAMVTLADGQALRGQLGASTNVAKSTTTALQLDGDLDADIVFHEYGHGLTWRMVGSMSGAISGAIGEGASDVLAFLLNGDDRIGEYSYSDPLGIRRGPYAAYPGNGLSYADVTGAEVHNDGELYAAAMWKVRDNYLAAGLSSTDLLHDWVQSLNLVNAGPVYEDMRDGLLAQVGATTTKGCAVWRGFAAIGMGTTSSSALVFKRGKYTVSITESFTVPPGC